MEYLNTNIQYKGLTDSGLTVTVLSSDDKKFSVWKKDREGNEGEAYTALLQYKFGETFGVSYGEKEESFVNEQGKTINFKKRTIYSIMPEIANIAPKPTPSTPTAETKRTEPSKAPTNDSNEFWEKKAYKQCLWNFWLDSGSYKDLPPFSKALEPEEMDLVWKVFNQIDQDANKRFSEEPLPEELPTIQQDPFEGAEEGYAGAGVDSSKIPF